VHPIHTVKYLEEVVLPNIARGAAKAGRSRNDVALSSLVFVITEDSSHEMAAARERVRAQVAFYASTRNYRVILETNGWGETFRRLNKKAPQGAWHMMAEEITDAMLQVFAVEGTPEAIPDKLQAKYDGILDRITFYHPFRPGEHEEHWRKFARAFNG